MALLLLCVILGFAPLTAHSQESPVQNSSQIKWSELPSLPDTQGLGGMFVGVHNLGLILAGGANFPDSPPWLDGEKSWYADIYVLVPGAEDWLQPSNLSRPLAYGGSVSTSNGVIFIGGCDTDRCYGDVTLWSWDPSQERLFAEALPSLPLPSAFLSAEFHKDAVYVLAGQPTLDPRSAEKHFWKLDLSQPQEVMQWEELEPWPGKSRIKAMTAIQNVGEEKSYFYVFGGEHAGSDAEGEIQYLYLSDSFRYDLQSQAGPDSWENLASLPESLAAGSALAVGQSHILVFSGSTGKHVTKPVQERPSFPATVLAYHSITDTWTVAGEMPVAVVTTEAVLYRGGIVIPSGETQPGIRTPRVQQAHLLTPPPRFGWINSTVLLLYLVVLLVMGVYFSRREKNTVDFFLAGRRIPWWAAGFSIYVTQLSAITFLSIPAVSFASNWLVFPALLAILMMAPIVVRFYLPFFRRLDLTTAYEYLEKRFSLGIRLFGSISFIAFQLVRMAIVMFLPALALSALTGINIYICILVMGVLATAYTILGGIEAVVWTDVLQSVVLLGGMIVTVVLILADVGGPGAVLATALEDQKLKITEWTWSLTALVTWSIVLGNFALQFGPYTTDQAVIQRYLTTKDERAAARGIWLNGFGSVIFGTLFFVMGTCMYVFFKLHPELLKLGMQNDEIFPLFIGLRLPVGISGLVIAGIFAASMSSLDSSMHSISTVVTTDFYRRFRPDAGERRYLKLARVVIALLGILVISVAFLLASYDIQSLYFFFNKALGLVSSGIVGIFILGIFTRKGSTLGAWIGAGGSIVVLIYVTWFSQLHFYLYPVVGIGVCVLVGFLASLFAPESKDLRGLSYRTLLPQKKLN